MLRKDRGLDSRSFPLPSSTLHSQMSQALPSRAVSVSVPLETEASANSSNGHLALTSIPEHMPGNKAPWKLFHPRWSNG